MSGSQSKPDVVVLGATGYTGKLVCNELAKAEIPFVLAGRDPSKLHSLSAMFRAKPDFRIFDATSETSTRDAIGGARVVINCAGPFNEMGEPVVRATLAAKAHYLDTTGEHSFMRMVDDKYNAQAVRDGVAIINAMAFEYALADCAAELLNRKMEGPEKIALTYAVKAGSEGGPGVSRGTMLSMMGMLKAGVLARVNGQWVTEGLAEHTWQAQFPGPLGMRQAISMPGADAIPIARHVPSAKDIRVYFIASPWLVKTGKYAIPAVKALLSTPVGPLAKLWVRRAAPPGPREQARKETPFSILLEGFKGERRNSLLVEGRDPYGLTGVIARIGAQRLLEWNGPGGVLSPSQVVDPEAFFRQLEPKGVKLVYV
ncbi:MAG: hypothetical protein GMKNLPBB_02263 [Myxococcota bacterium]|nr:hypothetical protein [Myxococcota bacterium]